MGPAVGPIQGKEPRLESISKSMGQASGIHVSVSWTERTIHPPVSPMHQLRLQEDGESWEGPPLSEMWSSGHLERNVCENEAPGDKSVNTDSH